MEYEQPYGQYDGGYEEMGPHHAFHGTGFEEPEEMAEQNDEPEEQEPGDIDEEEEESDPEPTPTARSRAPTEGHALLDRHRARYADEDGPMVPEQLASHFNMVWLKKSIQSS